MSLGCVKGKYWVADDRFAEYPKWDTYRGILPALRHAGYAVDIKFTYISHEYSAEIKRYEKRPWGYAEFSVSLAVDPNPMAAMVKAIRRLDQPGAVLHVYCLELEVRLLAESLRVARRREALLERLDFQLDTLNELLPAVRKFLPWVEPFCGTCGDTGFSGYGTGYGDVCPDCGGHSVLVARGEIIPPTYDEDDDL